MYCVVYADVRSSVVLSNSFKVSQRYETASFNAEVTRDELTLSDRDLT
jgi:hypothetical protein